MTGEVCAILLAAGLGRRFRQLAGDDQDKLLARCRSRDGREGAVLEHALRALDGQVGRTLLVTRPESEGRIALGRAYGCDLLLLDSAGMGESIAAAVARVPDCAGWLIVLGDMPSILPETIGSVVRALEDDLIVVPTCQECRGHPVGFGHAYGAQLSSLEGDMGAKRLFRDGRVLELAVSDPGVLRDVDYPDALVSVSPAAPIPPVGRQGDRLPRG